MLIKLKNVDLDVLAIFWKLFYSMHLNSSLKATKEQTIRKQGFQIKKCLTFNVCRSYRKQSGLASKLLTSALHLCTTRWNTQGFSWNSVIVWKEKHSKTWWKTMMLCWWKMQSSFFLPLRRSVDPGKTKNTPQFMVQCLRKKVVGWL